MDSMVLDIAHLILDLAHLILDIACLTLDIACSILDSQHLLVMLMVFLTLLLRRCKDFVQPCGGSLTAKQIHLMPLADL